MNQQPKQDKPQRNSVAYRTLFPGHPLFDSQNRLAAQIECPKAYPTLIQFLRRCPAGAREDWRQAATFLLRYRAQSNTYALYRGTLQRFLNYLWCLQKRTLREVRGSDIEGFLQFCQTPPDEWKSTGRFSSFKGGADHRSGNRLWRPFLSVTEARHSATYTAARVIVQKFLSDLSHDGYLNKLPRPSLPPESRSGINCQTAAITFLTEPQWAFLVKHLEKEAAQQPAMERTLYAVILLKSLFLRVSELARTPSSLPERDQFPTMADFVPRHWNGRQIWFLHLRGPRRKNRWIWVPEKVWPYIERYRQTMDLPARPSRNERTPLLVGRPQTALCKRQLERLVHDAMTSASTALETDGRLQEAHRFQELAGKTDCLRHTGAIQALASGYPVHRLSRAMGHHSIDQTINIYRVIGFKGMLPP